MDTFLQKHWLDLVMLVPFFRVLTMLRIIRMLRFLRLARAGLGAYRGYRKSGRFRRREKDSQNNESHK